MIKVHRNLTLLEADAQLLEELDLRGALDPLAQVALDARVRLIRDEQVDSLIERLLELGYLPGVEKE